MPDLTISKVIAENLKYYGWEGSEYPDLGELIRELPDDYFVSKDGRVFYNNYKKFPQEWEFVDHHHKKPEDALASVWIELKKAKQIYRCEGCRAFLEESEVEKYGSGLCHVVEIRDKDGNPEPSPCGPVVEETNTEK